MECPVCGERLREVEKYGVMVDICPGCKGVWLDRGELEKIAGMEARGDLDRQWSDDERSRYDLRPRSDDDRHGGERRDGHGESDRRHENAYHPRKRRSSFLGELLESFGD